MRFGNWLGASADARAVRAGFTVKTRINQITLAEFKAIAAVPTTVSGYYLHLGGVHTAERHLHVEGKNPIAILRAFRRVLSRLHLNRRAEKDRGRLPVRRAGRTVAYTGAGINRSRC